MAFTLYERALAKIGIVAGDHAVGTLNGTGIDTTGYNRALIILNSGTNGAGGTVDVKVQESSDDGATDAYADISGAAFSQITESNDNEIYLMDIDLTPVEKYIRTVGITGTATCDYGVDVILYRPMGQVPDAQDNTVVVV
jgi:hypothetical protein